MQIKGESLVLVMHAISGAISDAKNEIALCPDVIEFCDAITDLEDHIDRLQSLRARVIRALAKEGYTIEENDK